MTRVDRPKSGLRGEERFDDIFEADEVARFDNLRQVGWIDEHGNLWALNLRNGAVPSDRSVYVIVKEVPNA